MDEEGKTRPEERLGCEGYYGFGGGYVSVKMREWLPSSGPGKQQIYCNTCPLRNECWQKHLDRVRKIFPALTEYFDKFMDEARENDDDRHPMMQWQEHLKEQGEEMVEPYTQIMMGNMEDGMAVAMGGEPKDRGDHTLPYPFIKH